ncbi:MAG: alcohol dehydrogenase catalytic domain-containing protein [Pirellulales bacterium]|nr:alcohol dehydrogenase catalytic domain-containing protein [Pirellulales bacterium]
MRVAHFTGLRKLEISDEPEPKLDRPDGVLLRIDRVGVCGSDVHYYVGGRIGDQQLAYPATLGHECSGTVMEVGPAVTGLKPEMRVAVDPAIVCGQCDQCRAGRPNTCRNLQFMGCPGEAPGAVAEYRVLPAENCFPIPDSVSLEQAVLVEPLSVGLHAVRVGQIRPPARIAVLGAGPIGLSILLCAKVDAACTVYLTDLLDERLEVARQCGADWMGSAKAEGVTAAVAECEPQGLDLVFECSGDPACIDQAQQLLAPGGTLVLVGIPREPRVSFDLHVMRRAELTFRNVRRQTGCVAPIVRLIAEGRINTAPLLTHRFPLDRISEAFELVDGYREGVIKAVVDLSGAK